MTVLVSLLVRGLNEERISINHRELMEAEVAVDIAEAAGVEPAKMHDLLISHTKVHTFSASREAQEKIWPSGCDWVESSPEQPYTLMAGIAELPEEAVTKMAEVWTDMDARIMMSLQKQLDSDDGAISGDVEVVCHTAVPFSPSDAEAALKDIESRSTPSQAPTAAIIVTGADNRELESGIQATPSPTPGAPTQSPPSSPTQATGSTTLPEPLNPVENIHMGIVLKGLDADFMGASQKVFFEYSLAHAIAEGLGVEVKDVHDMDMNPSSVSIGNGDAQVRRSWWPRIEGCSDSDDDPSVPWTIVQSKIPTLREEAWKMSEKLQSEDFRNLITTLIDDHFGKQHIAVSGHVQVCAASDAHNAPPTTSTETFMTDTTITTTTIHVTRPPVLAGHSPTDLEAIDAAEKQGYDHLDPYAVTGQLGANTPPEYLNLANVTGPSGPTFTTTETTTEDMYVFSTGDCSECLQGDTDGEALSERGHGDQCHRFVKRGQQFVSQANNDVCLDLFNQFWSGMWGLWPCSGADNQVFAKREDGRWCSTKAETTKCLRRCGPNAPSTTTQKYLGINLGRSREWWDSRKSGVSFGGSLTLMIGALIVAALGVILCFGCCAAHRESAEQRAKHQYHADHYYSSGEHHHHDHHHSHHHYEHEIEEGDDNAKGFLAELLGQEEESHHHHHHHHHG